MPQTPLYPVIRLNQGKDDALRRFHPWVFSGAIHSAAEGLQAGDTVTVTDYNGEILGTGFCESDSIAVKMLSFDNSKIDEKFFIDKLNRALDVRKRTSLVGNAHTNCFRLVHSEGDGLAGLIIDVYGHTAVVQAQTEGMALHLNEIVAALKLLPDLGLQAVYNKSAEAMHRMGKEDAVIEDGYLFGNQLNEVILENDCRYLPNWEEGQKTGFFLDQRENRELVRHFAQGKTVLNAFGYTGGFSVAALMGGASRAVTVDASKKAIAVAEANLELNGFSKEENPCYMADMKDYVTNMRQGAFDLIILDPPAYGHGPDGEKWKLDELLFDLLKNVSAILAPRNSFLVLNLYSNGYSAMLGETLVREAFGIRPDGESSSKHTGECLLLESGELALRDSFGKVLPLSIFVRMKR